MSETMESAHCPNCNAPLADGHCIACDSAPSAPAQTEKVISVRVVRRWLVFILFVVALFSAGYYIWHTTDNWLSHMPSRVLLLLAGPDRQDVNYELVKRLEDGSLNSRHFPEVLSHQIGELEVSFLTPYPSGVEQQAVLTCGIRLPSSRWSSRIENASVAIDGNEIPESRYMKRILRDPLRRAGRVVTIPPLEPGSHDMTISALVVIIDKDAPKESREILRHPISATHTLQIEGDIGDYMKFQATRRQTRAFTDGLVVNTACEQDGEKLNFYLYFAGSKLPIGLAASVWVRSRGTLEYYRVGEIVSSPISSREFRFMRHFNVTGLPRIERTKAIEVRLVPDLNLAMKRKLKNCFAGVIDWSEVDIRRPIGDSKEAAFGEWTAPDGITASRGNEEPIAPETDRFKDGI